jgi:hypothetical protein
MATKAERNEKLAAALRENLKRRKARARARKTGADGKSAMPAKDRDGVTGPAPIPPRTNR